MPRLFAGLFDPDTRSTQADEHAGAGPEQAVDTCREHLHELIGDDDLNGPAETAAMDTRRPA